MDMIAVNGAELCALTLGSQDEAGAPPLVMLHGMVSGNLASWYTAYALPLSVQRQVLLYDQRGHGSSSLPSSGFDLDRQSEDLAAVLAHYGHGDEPVDLVGHSMGALIALHFALRWPQRVHRLVLVDAPMPAAEHVGPSLRGLTTPEALDAHLAATMPQIAGLKGRRRERQQQRLSSLFFASTLVADVLAMAAEPEAALRALALPVLLVYGQHSPCRAAGEALQRLLPQAELVWLDGGHYLPEETPAALLAELQRFLEPAAMPPPAFTKAPAHIHP